MNGHLLAPIDHESDLCSGIGTIGEQAIQSGVLCLKRNSGRIFQIGTAATRYGHNVVDLEVASGLSLN